MFILGMVYYILLYQHYMDFRKRKWVSLNMIYMAGSPNIVFVNLAELHFLWRIGRTRCEEDSADPKNLRCFFVLPYFMVSLEFQGWASKI